MAAPITSFDLIEEHKENIQPIRSGRSARALAASLSPLSANPHSARSEHYARQAEFEEELKTAPELDDPLEVWFRYINWTIETFPSGHSSESGLLPLLERATKEFFNDDRYKNDLRYLKLWIHYIQSFSDAPREVFVHLARNDVGQRLALFYEEWAALSETLGRKNQAAEIYQLGIDRNAQPIKRLERKFAEFHERLEVGPPPTDEPSSPALPTIRPALAAKPFGGSGGTGGIPDIQQQPQSQASKPPKQKMTIFSDSDQPSSATPILSAAAAGGWENIGSLQHRKKENAQEPKPWAGETLKQQGKGPQSEKLMIFRDNASEPLSSIQSMSSVGRRPERIVVKLELVYPQDEQAGEEFSFEELQAMQRGLYGIDWRIQREADEDRNRLNVNQRPILEGSRTPIKVKTILSPSPNKGKIRRKGRGASSPTMTFHTKAATDEIYSMFNQPLAKPSNGEQRTDSEDSDCENDSDGDYTTTTQIDLTTESRKSDPGDEIDAESDWSELTANGVLGPGAEGNRTDEFEHGNDALVSAAAANMEKLSIFSNGVEECQPRTQPRKLIIPPPPEDFDPPTLPYHQAKDQSYMQNRLPYMTPIVERTESLPGTAARNQGMQNVKTPSRIKMPVIDDREDVGFVRSPFHAVTNDTKNVKRAERTVSLGPIISDMLCNPLDENMRALVFRKLQPPLKTYEGFYEYPMTFGRTSEIKKYCKATSKRDADRVTATIPQTPVLDFITGEGGSSYTLKKELGKGAFAPVFLVENNTVGDAEDEAEEADGDTQELLLLNSRVIGRKRWEALKMEHPPSAWEFYIIRQTRERLAESRALASIIKTHELHLFSDEAFLFMEYRNQGTILDLVNIARCDATSSTGGMEELLVMFLAAELLRTTESLHACAIIHGDIKADNCLVRFEPVTDGEWSSRYQPDGSDGWSKKGVTLIDFGRGIDMKLYKHGVQFHADWKTDQQDCAEMREMRPWTYQVDYHGLAATIHSMLFGKYIETVAEGSQIIGGEPRRYTITRPFKRYWQQDIWSELFDVLLNPAQHAASTEKEMLPINASLRKCRERIERYLVGHCDKGMGLKIMIRKMEVAAGSRQK